MHPVTCELGCRTMPTTPTARSNMQLHVALDNVNAALETLADKTLVTERYICERKDHKAKHCAEHEVGQVPKLLV